MSQILDRIRDLDPNDSDAVKDALNTFFQNLSNREHMESNRWLRVLENIITRFPKYCSTHRNRIEVHIVHFVITNNSYYNAIEAAKCAHALQQVRPSQDKSATAKNCWREQMAILCNTAHMLIEAIFSKTVDIYKNSKKTEKQVAHLLTNTPLTIALGNILKVPQTDNAAEKKTILCERLRSVFVFIQAMLVEVYPVAKPIQPQLILEVIVQALSVSSSVNSDIAHAASVKTQALRTLDAMVACLGSNLVPFSALVFRFVMQTLRWSSDNVNEESRKVRCAAYASLSKWLCSLHAHRVADARGRSWEDELTNHIVEDITPPKRVVQLTMSNLPTKNLSKKAKRKLANSMLQQSNIASHMPGEKNKIHVSEEMNDEVADAALECAETFLTVCGVFLKPATHKVFQERLVRECCGAGAAGAARAPRLRLLRALDAARRGCAPRLPPPTHYCLQLYSALLHSACDEIKKFCSQALLDIRLHLHCSPPSLNFALEPQPDKRKADDKRKRISEKNRAALESLLGRERMPSEFEEEEVITIPDEPSTKKPRLSEDISDKISLSSESNSSVEINDDSDIEESSIQEDIIKNAQESVVTEIEVEPVIEDQIDSINTNQISSEGAEIPIEINENSEDNTETEINIPTDKTVKETIYEAKTQVPLNISYSNDTEEGDISSASMEVTYDYPNLTNKVTVLEKIDDENLPSTNDTDDIQITCGQDVKSSQELDIEKNKVIEEVPTLNGIDEVESGEKIVENGDVTEGKVTLQVISSVKEVTVDDMLADFVDEVNDDNIIEA